MNKKNRNESRKYLIFICTSVAVLYLVFRSFQLFSFLFSTGQRLTSNQIDRNAVICKTEANLSSDKPALISDTYINKIAQANSIGLNTVSNSRLNEGTDENGIPISYSHSADVNYATYGYNYDQANNSYYLEVKADKAMKGTTPSWLMDPVNVTKGTYSYGLKYVSNVPVSLSLEATLATGKVEYKSFVSAEPSDNWKLINVHFNNTGDVQKIRFILSALEPGYVRTKDYDLHQIDDAMLKSGIVTLTFDDGWKSVYSNAVPILEQHKMLASLFVITNTISKDGDRLNENDLKTLKNKGYEVGSHSLSHCNQSTLSLSKLDYEAIHGKKVLEDTGVGPITSFSYPLGSYDEQSQSVYSKYFKYIRTSDEGYNDKYFDKSNIKSMAVTFATTDADLEKWLRDTKNQNGWLVINYHSIGGPPGDYSISIDKFKKQIEMISKSGLEVMPLTKAGDSISTSEGRIPQQSMKY